MAGWHGLGKDLEPYNPEASAMVPVGRKELAVLKSQRDELLTALRKVMDLSRTTSSEIYAVAFDAIARATSTTQPADVSAVEN